MELEMTNEMEDILQKFGWADGFDIPVLNEENRILMAEVTKKRKEQDNLRFVLKDVEERLSSMKKHLNNVEKEQSENQKLLYAHQNQLKTEQTILRLSQVEHENIKADSRKMEKELADIMEREKILQTNLNLTIDGLEKLKTTVKWDKDALLAWDEENLRGEEDTAMLQRFTKEDEVKFKEMELKRQNLRMDVEMKKKQLEEAKNEVLMKENMLDKTAQMYRDQHADRQELIRQWECSVRVLHQRDDDINNSLQQIGTLRTLANEKTKELNEHKLFYENEKINNEELTKKIELTAKESAEAKEKNQFMMKMIDEMSSQVKCINGEVAVATNQLYKQRSVNRQMDDDVVKIQVQCEEMKEKLKRLNKNVEEMKNQAMSSVERNRQLENMYEAEEKIKNRLLNDEKKLSELIFKVNQQLKDLNENKIQQQIMMEGIRSGENMTSKFLAKTSEEIKKLTETLYNLDFAYAEKDIQYNHMLGARLDDDETMELEKKVEELQATYDKKMATNVMLTKETVRLEEEMKRMTSAILADNKELEILKNRKQDNQLLTDGGIKQLKTIRNKNQDRQVEENILKLKVKKMQELIDKVGGKVCSLEKQRYELETAMKERETEISSHRDELKIRKRTLSDQIDKMNSKISLAKLKVETLNKKYEVLVGGLGKDEDGQQVSVTYFKIKAAQERFELQELGDKLDVKIKTKERDIAALENTVKLLNYSNKFYKNSLSEVDRDGPEIQEMAELEAMYHEELQKLKEKKSQLQELRETSTKMEESYKEQIKIEDEIAKNMKDKNEHLKELQRDLQDQEEKLERADKILKKLIKDVRGTQMMKFQTIEEKDIELRELQEQNQGSLQQLAEIVARYMDTGPVVQRLLSEKNISLPAIKSPSGSIKYASSTSLLSPTASHISVTSSRSSDVHSSRSSCAITPSVVTLDATQLSTSGRSDTLDLKSSAGKVLFKSSTRLEKLHIIKKSSSASVDVFSAKKPQKNRSKESQKFK